MQDIYLSPHFELREFTESATARKYGIANKPPAEAVENLRALCVHTLEPLREKLGLPVIVTSGFRTKALNDIIVHSARKSQHMEGRAADFVVQGSKIKVQGGQSPSSKVKDQGGQSPSSKVKVQSGQSPSSKVKVQSLKPRELLIKAFRLIIEDEGIDFDQLILYPTFIHVSYVSKQVNRHKLTKANGQGTYCALTRAEALSLV